MISRYGIIANYHQEVLRKKSFYISRFNFKSWNLTSITKFNYIFLLILLFYLLASFRNQWRSVQSTFCMCSPTDTTLLESRPRHHKENR